MKSSFKLIPSLSRDMISVPGASVTKAPDPATEGIYYSDYLTADGDIPMTWSVSAGSLPEGLEKRRNARFTRAVG